MFNSSKKPKGTPSPHQCQSEKASDTRSSLNDDNSSTHSNASKKSETRCVSCGDAKTIIPRSGSPDSENVPPQANRFASSRNASTSWKVKISNHLAPPEQEERYVRTRERVNDIVVKILGYGSSAARDMLQITASVLQFAPVGGLAPAAQTLVCIWNALELVESNQLACLSLTERCVDTLIVIRDEINEAGEGIEAQLQFPLSQLNESFNAVRKLIEDHAHRPFFKRYLKRREIQGQIEACDARLSNALDLFSLKIQIRSLQRLELAEARRRAGELRTREDLKKVLDCLPENIRKQEILSLTPIVTVAEIEPEPEPEPEPTVAVSETPNKTDQTPSGNIDGKTLAASLLSSSGKNKTLSTASEVREALNELVLEKNNIDFALDLAEFRSLIREAVETASDDELLGLLQIEPGDVPEVLKELQRVLQDGEASAGSGMLSSSFGKLKEMAFGGRGATSKRDEQPPMGIKRARTMPTKLYEQDINDDLDRTFIECTIRALKRTKSV